MVFFAGVVFDFGAGALIFVVSLVAALCTRRYCFRASVDCVSIFKTLLAARWSFIIFLSLSFCLFSRISMNNGGYFSLKVSKSGVNVLILVFIQVAFCTSQRLYSFFSSLQ